MKIPQRVTSKLAKQNEIVTPADATPPAKVQGKGPSQDGLGCLAKDTPGVCKQPLPRLVYLFLQFGHVTRSLSRGKRGDLLTAQHPCCVCVCVFANCG